MLRKVVAVWVSLAMVFGFVVIMDTTFDFIPSVKGATLYVNETGSGGAFTKIQDAINASSGGDTILVFNGSYYENVVVNKTINLTGEDMNYTIVDGKGTGKVIHITADYVNITSLTLTGAGNDYKDAGISIDSNHNTISNNNVSNNKFGIFLNYSNENNLSKNYVTENMYGIWFIHSHYNIIISNNASSNSNSGISLWDSNSTQLISNIASWNHFEEGIQIHGSDMTNLSNNTVLSNDARGIYIDDSKDFNVIGNNLSHNQIGVFIYQSTNVQIRDNTALYNLGGGIYLSHSDGNNITGNIASYSNQGINLDYSESNYIEGNIARGNKMGGISLQSSIGNNITDNTMKNNGVFINGEDIQHWITNEINTSNTVNGKPVYYWKNQISRTVPDNAGQVILGNCTNIKINDHDFIDTTVGVELGFSSNCSITGIKSTNGIYGFLLYESSGNHIANSNGSQNLFAGIGLSYSNENIITNGTYSNATYNGIGISLSRSHRNNITYNNASSNIDYGISLFYADMNNITGNTALNNDIAIRLHFSKGNNIIDNIARNNNNGLYIFYSDWNTVKNNTATNNSYGIYHSESDYNTNENNTLLNNSYGIYISKSNENVISGNIISLNSNHGIFIDESRYNEIKLNNFTMNNVGIYVMSDQNIDNVIYHNNIIDNSKQAYDYTDTNLWDNGYPEGGNYWSDYDGIDLNGTPTQDVPPPDGIGDTPYLIDSDSQDNFPLMAPYFHRPYENYTILKNGWNLISIPLIQVEQSLAKVLESINGYYDAVQWFDISHNNDPWKHHKIGKPLGNDLSELNETMSFWIHITQPGDTIFLYNGTQPTTNLTIQLHSGWNMVGYPSLTNHNRTIGLNNLEFGVDVDAIHWFDASAKTWHFMDQDDVFIPGRGYWVHSKVETTWDVPL
jgi:parallel beta-helix repeat protein